MKIYNVVFANNLKRQLDLNGLKQKDLAKKMDITEAAVSDWCAAEKTPRNFGELYRLCDVLNCTVSDLLEPHSQLPEGAIPLLRVEKRVLAYAKFLQADSERLGLSQKLFDIPDEDLAKVSAMLDIFVKENFNEET